MRLGKLSGVTYALITRLYKAVTALPVASALTSRCLQVLLGSRVDYYRISVRAASQNVLPLSKNAGPNCAAYTPGAKTNVFGYGTLDKGKATHGWPALTIEAMVSATNASSPHCNASIISAASVCWCLPVHGLCWKPCLATASYVLLLLL